MRVGTWNLAGRWGPEHKRLLADLKCDVLLLTEVNVGAGLDGYWAHTTAALMRPKVSWASVLSLKPLRALPDPHPATAAAEGLGFTWCSSVLPWRSCGADSVWTGGNHAERTQAAVVELMSALGPGPLVWGGDWNHALSGREHAGSMAGRRSIEDALRNRDLEVATAPLPHALDGLLSIDHIAVPRGASTTANRIKAVAGTVRLSDHDAYLVEWDGPLADG